MRLHIQQSSHGHVKLFGMSQLAKNAFLFAHLNDENNATGNSIPETLLMTFKYVLLNGIPCI